MTETPAIYSDLVKVMRTVGAVGKDGYNSGMNFNFRGIDGVLDAVGPALREHGVVVIPTRRSVTKTEALTSGNKKTRVVDVEVDYTFYSSVDGSSVVATVPGEAMDSGDKGTAKAMSVAYRTCLIQALSLPTTEPDPDSFTYVREALEEQHRHIAGQVERASTVEELRELWPKASPETQKRITDKVAQLQEPKANGAT